MTDPVAAFDQRMALLRDVVLARQNTLGDDPRYSRLVMPVLVKQSQKDLSLMVAELAHLLVADCGYRL